MYVLELAFDGNHARLDLRPAHRERLARLFEQKVLVMAGPYADDSGALLIFDVPDVAGLARVVADDPYYRAPGVTIVRQQEWTPIFR
jgi:uncharacterized protein